ncbi:cobyric acid synthase [Paenibacillus bouchesdurhonensis]|uniref:cobyric acid synthase n=1 Tax=Paenibacillus bouchesdurhonensis TaxID=1870990 RepID=UPI000DA5F307|nr:cobyric acid synthase [Paenibacillus bouchesdurhonensis]
MKSLMIVGTSSSCGKSFITAALLRMLRNKGYAAAPFKAQNISSKFYITGDHSEIAYSTYIQALSAGVVPEADMNPILIKPAYDETQIFLNGKLFHTGCYTKYGDFLPEIRAGIENSFQRLAAKYDILIIEGAGSTAEINLANEDVANIFTAKITKSPLLLVSDIHYGGVFAAIHGTIDLLDESIKDQLEGFLINRYQGIKDVLQSGIDVLEKKHGVPCAGVLPYQQDIVVPDEQGFDLMADLLESNMDLGLISRLLGVSL